MPRFSKRRAAAYPRADRPQSGNEGHFVPEYCKKGIARRFFRSVIPFHFAIPPHCDLQAVKTAKTASFRSAMPFLRYETRIIRSAMPFLRYETRIIRSAMPFLRSGIRILSLGITLFAFRSPRLLHTPVSAACITPPSRHNSPASAGDSAAFYQFIRKVLKLPQSFRVHRHAVP